MATHEGRTSSLQHLKPDIVPEMLHWRASKGATLLNYCCLICCPNNRRNHEDVQFSNFGPEHTNNRCEAALRHWALTTEQTVILENRRRSKFNWRRISEGIFQVNTCWVVTDCRCRRLDAISTGDDSSRWRTSVSTSTFDKAPPASGWKAALCISSQRRQHRRLPRKPRKRTHVSTRWHERQRTWQLDSRLIPVIMQKWGRKEPEMRIFFPKL